MPEDAIRRRAVSLEITLAQVESLLGRTLLDGSDNDLQEAGLSLRRVILAKLGRTEDA